MSDQVVAAVIGVIAALAAVAVTQWFNRDAERRRWDRDERLRVTKRGEDAARRALRSIHDATELFSPTINPFKQESRLPPAESEIRPPVALVRRTLVEIPNEVVRETLLMIANVLPFTGDVAYMHKRPEAGVAAALREAADATVGAYLRGEEPPRQAEIENWFVEVVQHNADLAYAKSLAERADEADSPASSTE